MMAGAPVIKTSPLAQFRSQGIARAPCSRVVTAVAQRKAAPVKKGTRELISGALP